MPDMLPDESDDAVFPDDPAECRNCGAVLESAFSRCRHCACCRECCVCDDGGDCG